mgnify:CR=1 FL=1
MMDVEEFAASSRPVPPTATRWWTSRACCGWIASAPHCAPSSSRTRTSSRPRAKTRLDATKEAIKTFVRSRKDDRIGLVAFALASLAGGFHLVRRALELLQGGLAPAARGH